MTWGVENKFATWRIDPNKRNPPFRPEVFPDRFLIIRLRGCCKSSTRRSKFSRRVWEGGFSQPRQHRWSRWRSRDPWRPRTLLDAKRGAAGCDKRSTRRSQGAQTVHKFLLGLQRLGGACWSHHRFQTAPESPLLNRHTDRAPARAVGRWANASLQRIGRVHCANGLGISGGFRSRSRQSRARAKTERENS